MPRRRSRHLGTVALVRRGKRDLSPICSARIFVGSGIPVEGGYDRMTYRGVPLSFDKGDFMQALLRLLKSRSSVFPGATIYKAKGFWQGATEDSLVVEVNGPDDARACRSFLQKVEAMSRLIARSLGQNSVYVTASSKGEPYGGEVRAAADRTRARKRRRRCGCGRCSRCA